MSVSAARPAVRKPDLRALAARLPGVPLMVGALTVGTFLLYLSQIHQSLFADELYTTGEVVHHSFTGVLHTVANSVEVSPPLFFVLAWLSVKLGDPTVWIRLPSLILGTATIPVIYLLGRETIGRAAGAIGAAAFAVSPFALFYGVQARPYATAAFFTVLSTYALVRAIRSDDRRWWALYAVAAAAAAYSHYTAIFVLVVQTAWALWASGTRWRRPLIASLAAAVMYVPWLPHVHGGGQLAQYSVVESFTVRHVLQDVVRFVVGYPFAPLHAIPTVPGFAAIAVAVLLGVFVTARRYLSDRAHAAHELSRGGLPLIVALALATMVGVLLSSIVGTDIWYADHLYASAPAAALVLGALLIAIPRQPRVVAVPVVLGVLVLGTIRGISPSWRRPAYRTVAQYLDRVAKPRDPVVLFTEPVVFDAAIQAQLKRPHTVIDNVSRWWRRRSAGTLAFVVVDNDQLSLRSRALKPRGYALVARRRYTGLIDFTLFTYRAV